MSHQKHSPAFPKKIPLNKNKGKGAKAAAVTQPSPVFVNVYHCGGVAWFNNLVNAFGAKWGVFHAGVEVHGVELCFQGQALMSEDPMDRIAVHQSFAKVVGSDPRWQFMECRTECLQHLLVCTPSGIYGLVPRLWPDGKGEGFKEQILMGETCLSLRDVFEVIQQLGENWNAEKYQLLENNCCHFANELCSVLVSKPIPGSINAVASYLNGNAKQPTPVNSKSVPPATSKSVPPPLSGSYSPTRKRTDQPNVKNSPAARSEKGGAPRSAREPNNALNDMLVSPVTPNTRISNASNTTCSGISRTSTERGFRRRSSTNDGPSLLPPAPPSHLRHARFTPTAPLQGFSRQSSSEDYETAVASAMNGFETINLEDLLGNDIIQNLNTSLADQPRQVNAPLMARTQTNALAKGVNDADLAKMIDLGFGVEEASNALRRTSSLESAVHYILSRALQSK
eukprot:Platyproteum_vivax@DN5369_c0_g1_i1.p1